MATEKLRVEKNKYTYRWRKNAVREFGTESAAEILRQVNILFEQMCFENDNDLQELKEHTENLIYPTISLYKVLQKYTDKQNALSLTEEWFLEPVRAKAASLKNFIGTAGTAAEFPGMFAEEMRNTHSERAGFRISFLQTEQSLTRLDVLKCPYVDFTNRYGCPELCQCFCLADDICYGDLDDNLLWKRTKTLASGDERCDFNLLYSLNIDEECSE